MIIQVQVRHERRNGHTHISFLRYLEVFFRNDTVRLHKNGIVEVSTHITNKFDKMLCKMCVTNGNNKNQGLHSDCSIIFYFVLYYM